MEHPKVEVGQSFDTTFHGRCTIVEYINNKRIEVEFEDGERVFAKKQSLLSGNVKHPKNLKDIRVGMVFQNKNHDSKFRVKSIVSFSEIVIEFLNTGTLMTVASKGIRSLSIKDPFEPSVYGVGFIGVGTFAPSYERKSTKAYAVWRGMLQRCYLPKETEKSYAGVTVCLEWLDFQNFASWFYKNYAEGTVLDKDLTSWGNKVYCPKYCTFISPADNSRYISSVYNFAPGINVIKLHNLKENINENT